jgi:signal transduction histidine kinase
MVMEQPPDSRSAFEDEVAERFGIIPNFFRSARTTPELIEKLWSFAKSSYLDNPIPALFKERMFVVLSRLCPVRYCIVRHVGFLLGHGKAAGDAQAPPHSIADVIRLLKRPFPWNRDMSTVYAHLETLTTPLADWPEPWTEMEDLTFASAATVFSEPANSATARQALLRALGAQRFEYLAGLLAFIRTAHFWTMLHPEIETEDDMQTLMREHVELARLLMEDAEADRSEMSARLFNELVALRELNEREELKKAKAALEVKDRQKDQFMAIMAHELRNPLATIRSTADALKFMKLDDPRIERLLASLERQSSVMARMLDDLLDAARLAFGKVSLKLEDIDLSDLVRVIVGEIAPRIGAAAIELDCEIPSTTLSVKGDPVRLRQIIDNIISNSIKFTSKPGRIDVRLCAEANYAILRVKDTGIGFDADLAAQMFTPFVQHEQGIDHAGGGLGLGLAIGKNLAELHGGRLSGESPGIGHGATFTFTLPLQNTPVDPTPPRPSFRRSRKRVLVVEDNEDAAETLAQLLGLMGCEVDLAYEGKSALALANTKRPDLVLCDLGLPGDIDGFAVVRTVRSNAQFQNTCFVAVSGYSDSKAHAMAKLAGFDKLVAKPMTLEVLEKLISD